MKPMKNFNSMLFLSAVLLTQFLSVDSYQKWKDTRSLDYKFDDFLLEFHPNFSEDELNWRKNIFEAEIKRVIQHNQKVSASYINGKLPFIYVSSSRSCRGEKESTDFPQ